MSYQICIINNGYYFLADEDELMAKCTCVLIKGKKNVIVNTMSPWDDARLIEGLVKYAVIPPDIDYLVSTNGGSSYIGNNYMFRDSIHIVGHSIQRKNHFLPEPFSKGKPYNIDENNLMVIPTPGRTLNDVSVIVKTMYGIVAITGDLFIKDEAIENTDCWISSQSECPVLLRHNRRAILDMATAIIPGYGVMFAVTEEMKRSFDKPGFEVVPNVH